MNVPGRGEQNQKQKLPFALIHHVTYDPQPKIFDFIIWF